MHGQTIMAPGGNAAKHHYGFPVTTNMYSGPYWSLNRLSHSAVVVTGLDNRVSAALAVGTTLASAQVRSSVVGTMA